MRPLITVVIPTYKRSEFLIEAIESVKVARVAADINADQLEVIVVDDGHEDEVREVCEVLGRELDIVIRYQRSLEGPRAGASASRNQAINDAQGDLIYLLDDDDRFLPNRFVTSVRLLSECDYDAVFEPSLRVYDSDASKDSFITGPYGNPVNAFHFLLTGGGRSHITPGATAFTKKVFYLTGRYDGSLRYGEDGEYLLRLCLYGRVALIDGQPVVSIRIHENNISRPDRRYYWAPIQSLAMLYKKIQHASFPDEKKLVSQILSSKLDFALTRYRREAPSYRERIKGGAKALRYFNWRCASVNNFKSIVVWLTKSSES